MQRAIWTGSLAAAMLFAAGQASGCERYPGEQLPTIGLNEANLEPCGLGAVQQAGAQIVFLPRPMGMPPPEFFPDPLFQAPPRPPRACRTQAYQFGGGQVRVHRC